MDFIKFFGVGELRNEKCEHLFDYCSFGMKCIVIFIFILCMLPFSILGLILKKALNKKR